MLLLPFAGLLNRTLEKTDQGRFFRSLPREQFTNMIRLASHTTDTGWQEEFEFGLDVLMDGFRQRLTD